LAQHPRATIDSLHAWIVKRGYRICRSAVGRYVLYHRRLTAGLMPTDVGMAELNRLAALLDGEGLKSLTAFAAFLAAGRKATARTTGRGPTE
jgi:hypothetical protein